MSKHRREAPKKPSFNQWDSVEPQDRNMWQRIAAKTNGWLAPAMSVTAAGNVAAFAGIEQACVGNTTQGAVLFGVGRVFDFIDGKVARATGTSSSKGEAFDVGFDKLQIIGGLAALSITEVYPLEASLPKIGTQLAITAVGAVAAGRGIDIHPGWKGKFNMGATSASMASFIAADAIPATQEVLHNALEYGGGYGLTAASIVAGTWAAVDYAREVYGRGNTPQIEPTV